MHIELQRTFIHYSSSRSTGIEGHLDDGNQPMQAYLKWPDIHCKQVAVVLGEAGIGKTVAFQLEVKRLKGSGHSTFFIPLNLLKTIDDWKLALGSEFGAFSAWEGSREKGFFFLDAIDEARLLSHSDFIRALRIVQATLSAYMTRIQFVLSSRVTDWMVPEVAAAVAAELVAPIIEANSKVKFASLDVSEACTRTTSQDESDPLLVVTLEPLARAEAQRCALHFGLRNDAAFWDVVDSSGYDFMTNRPLDLRWMVDLWNAQGRLGTYIEMLEVHIDARLNEVNPSYQQAGKVLSKDQLRIGATRLAAAAEFGRHAFIAVQPSVLAEEGLQAHLVLHDWVSTDVQLLLSSGIFDEASFGRLRFHHRSLREYLSACWVDHELHKGVPLHRIRPLFTSQPFDELVLIPARRAALSWLAAINIKVRSWVVYNFSELLFYGGDIESWDKRSTNEALKIFADASKFASKARWYVSDNTCTRVARVVAPASVAAILKDNEASHEARAFAYRLVRCGKLKSCADPAFANYGKIDCTLWERTAALSALGAVGAPEHRAKVLYDLELHKFLGNRAVSEALVVINWHELSSLTLTTIFNQTESEAEDEGCGFMAMTLKEMLLSNATLVDAELLLKAVHDSCASKVSGMPLIQPSAPFQSERDWRIYALVGCLEQVFYLARQNDSPLPQACVDAAVLIDDLRLAGLIHRDEVTRLCATIKTMPAFRWQVTLAIACSEPIGFSKGRLAGGAPCIVTLEPADIPELIKWAHDVTTQPTEQAIWFELCVETVLRLRSRFERKCALRGLFPRSDQRAALVCDRYRQLRSLRAITVNKPAKAAKLATPTITSAPYAKWEQIKSELDARRAQIADGEDLPSLLRLVNFTNPGELISNGRVIDLGAVDMEFGEHIATAFRLGLLAYRGKAVLSSPLFHYQSGRPQKPMPVRIAEASINLWITDGVDCVGLSGAEVAVAAQVAVWSNAKLPEWFHTLCQMRSSDVIAALTPWLLEDVGSLRSDGIRQATLAMVLQSPCSVRHKLLMTLIPLVHGGRVGDEATLKQLVVLLNEAQLIQQEEFDSLCRDALERYKDASGYISDLTWLRLWMAASNCSAWNWFSQHLATLAPGHQRARQIDEFATAMWDSKWVWESWTSTAADLLTDICEVLFGSELSGTSLDSPSSASGGGMTERMYSDITQQLIGIRGKAGRQALQRLVSVVLDAGLQRHLKACLVEHAEREAEVGARWRPDQLRDLHKVFDSAPASEAQLYEQVLARLEEIRTSLEEGPFSERPLFKQGMPEKHLQLWLAAKLQDTQNLRFSIHREEEVDDDKRTDIQCACARGNVCIEIKPLDSTRNYSAKSLVDDTLTRQIVGQYLIGRNSSHGILVLMELEKKGWDLPGAMKQSFDELVKHVQLEANKIKENMPSVAELLVFSIRCTI